MNRYEIEVDFDDRIANQRNREAYFGVLDRYSGMGIRHKRKGISTMLISSNQSLDLGKLTEELEDIRILSISRN